MAKAAAALLACTAITPLALPVAQPKAAEWLAPERSSSQASG